MARVLVLLALLPSLAAGQEAVLSDSTQSAQPETSTVLVDSAAVQPQVPVPSLLPSAVESLVVIDAPNDAGGAVNLYWTLSIDEGLGVGSFAGYEVLRAGSAEGPFVSLATLGPGTDRFTDRSVHAGASYYYKIRTTSRLGGMTDSEAVGPVKGRGQWFDSRRVPVLAGLLVILLVVLTTRVLPPEQEWILPAVRTLKSILGRKHAGSVVFVPGTGGVGDMGTIASLTLLEQVVRVNADEGPPVVVYTSDPMTNALITEEFGESDTRFVCPDRMVFSLAFTGEALRQPPGVGLLVGSMGSEAFLLAETLRRSGSVAVGGTTDVAETPFLITSCDLTLIGEELFLVGPALAPDGCRAATLVHDRLKVLTWILILIGVAAAKFGVAWYMKLFGSGAD